MFPSVRNWKYTELIYWCIYLNDERLSVDLFDIGTSGFSFRPACYEHFVRIVYVIFSLYKKKRLPQIVDDGSANTSCWFWWMPLNFIKNLAKICFYRNISGIMSNDAWSQSTYVSLPWLGYPAPIIFSHKLFLVIHLNSQVNFRSKRTPHSKW